MEIIKKDNNETNVIYMNFESFEFDNIINYKDMYNEIKKHIKDKEKVYILLDEVQRVEKWEKCVNALTVDFNCDIYNWVKRILTILRIIYIFIRQICRDNQVEEGCQWIIEGEGYATEKLDGTCCMIKDGKIYRRYDYKNGRKLPQGAIPCQKKPDPITGHFPHWLLCVKTDGNSKYYLEAIKRQPNLQNGTYELIGKHINANPYKLDKDILERHGERILENVPRNYDGIKKYLEEHYIEGIVFYRENGEMCKIKRSDFNFEWNIPD